VNIKSVCEDNIKIIMKLNNGNGGGLDSCGSGQRLMAGL
jgi:hypothetical protein